MIMLKATPLLFAVLLALACYEQVLAHVGRGMPVHHQLHPRVGTTTDKDRRIDILRRSLHSDNQKRTQYLHDSINENVKRAAAKDGFDLVSLQKRQSSGDFGSTGGSTSSSSQTNQHGTTEDSAAKLTDPTQECTPYNLPMVGAIKSAFPPVWTLADILEGDDEATTVLQTINGSGLIPSDIGVRGVQPTSLSGADLDNNNYPLAEDPDCWWTDNMCTTPKHAGLLPDITSCNEPMTWGYTFDDGPNCTHNALYDMWAANNQKASLMYIGSNVLDWPLEAQRGIVDGHHICVHTWSHRYMTALTTNQAFAELWYTMKVMKYVMGITPTCWRPPYGDIDDRIRGIAQGLGLRTIMWDTDTNDWNIEPYGHIPTASLRQTYSSIISMATMAPAATHGIIVLEHELESSAMNMSIEQYPAVKAAWKHVVPLNACLNITKPYAEDITYPNFEDYVAGHVLASGLPDGRMNIVSSAQVTAQGTLSGMAGGITAAFPTSAYPAASGTPMTQPTSSYSATAKAGSSGALGAGASETSSIGTGNSQHINQFGSGASSSFNVLPGMVFASCAMIGALLVVL